MNSWLLLFFLYTLQFGGEGAVHWLRLNQYNRLQLRDTRYGWLPFCSTSFQQHHADLYCKLLGYSNVSWYFKIWHFTSQAVRCGPDTCNNLTQCNQFIHLGCSVRDEQSQSWLRANGSLRIKTIRYGWLPVCSESFVFDNANTYCQLLGYSRVLRYFRTTGNQSGLKCDRVCNRLSNCVHNVLLICTHERFAPQYRLVSNNDTTSSSGLLEFFNVYWNHTKGIGGYDWLPHCIETFNILIADYYCRKLGYSHADRYDTVTALGFPESTSPVSVQVTHFSPSWIIYTDEPECNHSMNVGLVCSNYRIVATTSSENFSSSTSTSNIKPGIVATTSREKFSSSTSTSKIKPGIVATTSSENFSSSTSTSNIKPELKSNTVSSQLVGGAFGGVLFMSSLLLVLILVIIIGIKIRRNKFRSKPVTTGISGIENATYEANQTIYYSEVGPKLNCEHQKQLDNQEEIRYAECGASSTTTKSHSETTYEVPSFEEEALYAQLENITSGALLRQSIRLNKRLGAGQFGEVYKAVWQSREGEVAVAVKTLKEGAREEDKIKFLQEAAIMGQFKHPNVVTMHGIVSEGEPILLVLELLVKGDLRSFLLKEKSSGLVHLNEKTLLSFCRQISIGMEYLSSKGFVHRDLAARNILMSSDDKCKIADFGMSRNLMYDSYYVSHGGMIPVKWTAPEALHYKKYSTASDVWSFGALMYEIWSVGHKPFENYNNNKVIRVIDSGYRLPPPPGCPREIYALMIECWHPKTAMRPSFKALNHNLSRPDFILLLWSEEDKLVNSEADKLGASLEAADDLYSDLQVKYQGSS